MRKIHLVGKYEDSCIFELWVIDEGTEYLCCLFNALLVITVHHENETLGVLEVMLPKRSESCLATNIPAVELKIFVLDIFDIESDGGYRVDCLVQLELVKNGGLSGSIEAEEQKPDWSCLAEPAVYIRK